VVGELENRRSRFGLIKIAHTSSRKLTGEKSVMHRSKWMVLILGACMAIFSAGCGKLKSRDQMNKGVQAYKGAHYQAAVKHFKSAVEFDPTNQNAQLYLATSYMTQWVPGADSPDNNRMLNAARTEFQKVLDKDPQNKTALASMAFMAYSQASSGTPEEKDKALDEARKWDLRRVEADPKDAGAYYSLGVIAWAQAYPAITSERSKLRMKPSDPGPIKDEKVRTELQQKYGQIVDQGMDYLQKAINIDGQNDDAMTYLNLLLRKKADLEDSPDAAKVDVAKAEEWANKSLDIKKFKATRPQKQAAG
jgi:tetratricopeptide (TPR) repeat protein